MSCETCTLSWHISQVLASYANVYELITGWLFLFKVGCIISTKYLNVLYDTVLIVDTMVLIG